jgi:xanthine dehydrogenase YagT iron-sulfur-binding subunit
MPVDDACPTGATRRGFLQSAGALAGAPLLGHAVPAGAATPTAAKAATVATVVLHVNGQAHSLALEPRVTLLDALRDHLALTGTKKGCDRGQCGACTVLVNGERILACLSLAIAHQGDEITTIEGLGNPGALHPMQAAFVAEDAFQCGYCTPGQICSAVAMLAEVRRGDASAATSDLRAAASAATLDDDEIRERLSGNLCRCGAYPNIVRAVRSVVDHPGGSTT